MAEPGLSSPAIARIAAVTTGTLPPGGARAATHALARAFDDDDWFRWLLPDGPRRYRALRLFFGGYVSDCRRHGRVDVATEDGLTVAVAAWMPPGAYPPSPSRQAAKAAPIAAAIPMFPRRLPIVVRVLTRLDQLHPKEEHWYLAALGTDPSRWRRGLASRLLEPTLARADQEGLPCYLETQAERNLAFYGRHGFEVREEIRVPGCPLPLWTMRRSPRDGV